MEDFTRASSRLRARRVLAACGVALLTVASACAWEESAESVVAPSADAAADAIAPAPGRDASTPVDAAGDSAPPVDPSLLATGVAPTDIVVDATHVYWVEAGRTREEDAGPAKLAVVRRASKSGGQVEVVAQNDRPFAGLVVDAQNLYTTTSLAPPFLDRLVRKTKDGKGASQVVAILKTPFTDLFLRDDATAIFVGSVSRVPSTVLRVEKEPAEAGAPAPTWLTGSASGPRYLDFVVGSDGVYATWNDWTVQRIDKSDVSAREVFGSEQVDPSGVALDGTNLFWTSSGAGMVMRAPRRAGDAGSDAGPEAVVGFTPAARPTKLRANATHLVWLDGSTIKKVKKTGGAVSDVVEVEGITDFAVDETQLFWTERTAGLVRRRNL